MCIKLRDFPLDARLTCHSSRHHLSRRYKLLLGRSAFAGAAISIPLLSPVLRNEPTIERLQDLRDTQIDSGNRLAAFSLMLFPCWCLDSRGFKAERSLLGNYRPV
jgi:hypothetical protein